MPGLSRNARLGSGHVRSPSLLLSLAVLLACTLLGTAAMSSSERSQRMEAFLRARADAQLRHRARFDLGEHGTLFNRFAGLTEFKADDGFTYHGAELVGFFGDFFADCSLGRVICTRQHDIELKAMNLVNMAYKLDSKNKDAAQWLDNVRRLRTDEFETAYGKRSNGSGEFPATVDGGLTPSRSAKFWAGSWLTFHMKWVKDAHVKKLGQTGHFCSGMQSLNANSDHFSSCARKSGKVLLSMGLNHIAAHRGTKQEAWGYFAIFAGMHFLTDQFAPGHVRVPAVSLREKCYTPGEETTGLQLMGGMSVNAMHDLDNIQGLHLSRPLGADMSGAVPQNGSLGGKSVHTLWKGFGDHRYYTTENSVNKQAMEEFVGALSDLALQYRNGSKASNATVEDDVSSVMKLIPRWRWSAMTVAKDSCPFYFANCKPANKDKHVVEVEDGEELEPDCDLNKKHMDDVWRLKHPTEKKVPKVLRRTLKIKGTDVHCDYVAFLEGVQNLDPKLRPHSGCFKFPEYEVVCNGTKTHKVWSPSSVESGSSSSSLQPEQQQSKAKEQLRTDIASKCYLSYDFEIINGQKIGADWSLDAIHKADPSLKDFGHLPGGAPEKESRFKPKDD